MNKQVLPILNTIKETSSNSRTSSATSSPLSSAPNSPEWPCPDHPPGNSDTSTDSVTSAISYLGLSPESMRADFLTALRQLNDRAGTMLTPAEFQAAVSLIDNRYGVKTCGAALLGLGPDYSLGMGNIGTNLSLEELNVLLTLVNDRYGTLIAASDILEWLHQARIGRRLPWKDEVRGSITAALAFLGVVSSMEVSLADLEKTFEVLDLKGTGEQIMTVLMSMPDD